MVTSKRCSKCRKIKKARKFYRSLNASCGLQAQCIDCHKTRPRKKEVVSFECEKCHLICQRVAKPIYKEVLRRKVCCRCARLEVLAKNGGRANNYKGTKHFPGKTIAQWKLSAKRRNHFWALTVEDLDRIYESQQGLCALSGLSMVWAGPKQYRPSIDRIDSTRGYSPENIQFVCSVINIMKNKIDESEFIRLCTLIVEYKTPIGRGQVAA